MTKAKATTKFAGTLDDLKARLASGGISGEWKETANGVHQLKCADGVGINWSSTRGTIWLDGPGDAKAQKQAQLDTIIGTNFSSQIPATATGVSVSRKVFVVYGHDDKARTELEAMLRRWHLEPLILDQLTSGGQTIIEKLETYRREASFAVVLATPDDEGFKKDHPADKLFRARQNVVLELGMMLAVMGRQKVAILKKIGIDMENPSDIQGLIYIPFKDIVTEAALILAKEINAQGIPIDLSRV